MQYQGIDEQKIVNVGLQPIAKDLNLQLVATNDVHYLQNSDFKPHDILLCIGTGKTVNDTERLKYHGDQFYLKTAEEMAQVFGDFPEAMANTVRIAERCNVDLSGTVNHLPNFDVPAGFTLDEYFEHVVRQGFEMRLPRLQELAVRGRPEAHDRRVRAAADLRNRDDQADEVPGYFLITWDFIRYAREKGIPVGPGPRIGGRQLRRLLPADHRRRSDRVRPDLRALPESRARVAARHRHRLLRAAPRRGHRVRHREVRPRERRADHHLRHDEGARGGPRRRPRHGHSVRRRRPRRQGGAAGARHDARQGARREPGAQGACSRRTSGSRSCSPSRSGSRA